MEYDDIESEFDQALALRDEGKMREAERILIGLSMRRADVAAVFGMLGHVQEEMGNLGEAAKNYRRASELNPGSELASISLFHALYSLDDVDGALAEMRRFRTRGPSPEYDRLIADLKLDS